MSGPSTAVQAAYAAPALGLALVGTPVCIHVPRFCADVVGVGIAAVGAATLGVRAFDALDRSLHASIRGAIDAGRAGDRSADPPQRSLG